MNSLSNFQIPDAWEVKVSVLLTSAKSHFIDGLCRLGRGQQIVSVLVEFPGKDADNSIERVSC